ncbi:Gfo/Idh/MocA family protein [Pseudarthrobacter sp. P1]|uniref:Gfo/Idh/MocA family protein n=1 Tax=Pseudarthrobacter sp. P1 TaxID=3418418 RepID=UPI003CFA6AED
MSNNHLPPAKPLGVGILGAGPVTQAIHLPALARLSGLLEVRHIMDVDPAVAESVAARVGAASSSSMDALLADPAVDVIAICSPHQFHAEQVIASCLAGKKAVLCEKPFALDAQQASRIAKVSAKTGVPILVGAMHTFDPGWLAAENAWGDLPSTAHTIRSSIVLPPNSRFEDFATQILTRPAAGSPDYSDLEVVKGMLRGGVMGLAIHDLPLVRRFLPAFDDVEVRHAEIVQPFGYTISLKAGDRSIELRAAMTRTWQPEWVFEAIGDDAALHIEFSPSYVQAGSATARITRGGATTVYGPYGHNGYEGEWHKLAELANGTGEVPSAEALINDLTFALDIADGTAAAATAAAALPEKVHA